MKGYFTFVLHSHLPYVINHGEWPHGMDWIYEAAAETYLPLLNEFDSLVAEGISPNVTLGITPILAEQLVSERFMDGFDRYLSQKIDAAKSNEVEFQRTGSLHLAYLAKRWRELYEQTKVDFDARYNRDLIGRYRELQDGGHLEIITCAATHGYFPLLGTDESIDAQVRVGKETYERHFNKKPRGIWLPECAYRPSYEWQSPISGQQSKFLRRGVEEFLFKYDIEYFIVDKSLIKGGKSKGIYIDRFDSLKQLWKQFEKSWEPSAVDESRSVYENYLVSSTGTGRVAAVYGRHEESALQVWSGEWGYPGDGRYLDFHKKHYPGGLQYWKVTSAKADLGDKKLYYPDDVEVALESQSDHFAEIVEKSLTDYHEKTGRNGILTAPFDTELFGHWWFEGPRWIGKVLRKLHTRNAVSTISLGDHLSENKPDTVVSLPEGSWGQGGFHYIWLNEWTEWTWKHIYESENRMIELSDKYKDTSDSMTERILNQIGRELLLLESSDWQFLISTWSARDYAEQRLAVHQEHIKRLDDILFTYIEDGKISEGDLSFITEIEQVDKVFPTIDFRYWCTLKI